MLKRGFKSWCEKTSLQYREKLGIDKKMPLNAFQLAEHLKIKTISPIQIQGISEGCITTLLSDESDSWSAVTICLNSERQIIVYNSSNVPWRQSNDIMHEISHVVIGHKAQMVHSLDAGLFLRHYDKDQEDEADWLAGTFLLPKDALFRICYSNDKSKMAKEYMVSEKLLNMRLNVSGVNRIKQRSNRVFS